MRSQRYEILPRAQYRPNIKLWLCVWKDPGDLLQTKGQPLRYVRQHHGVGTTLDEAMANCRDHYINFCNRRDAAKAELQRMTAPRIPNHCLATSNLPWWKRLFRI